MTVSKSQIPPDRSPAQRAILKVVWHFCMIFIVNSVLAGLTLLAPSNYHAVGWSVVAISAIAQGVLALLDATKKYFTAANQPLLSELIAAGQQEIASIAPAAPAPAQPVAAFQSYVNTALQPAPAASITEQPTRVMAALPSAVRGNSPPPGATLTNTLSDINLAAVKAPQG